MFCFVVVEELQIQILKLFLNNRDKGSVSNSLQKELMAMLTIYIHVQEITASV